MNFLSVIGAGVIFIPIAIGLSILAIAWRAWWLYPTWRWFIVPLGAPQISFWHFAALMAVISVLTHQVDNHEDKRELDWSKVGASFAMPIIFWAIFWWMKGRVPM